jgi:FkbM family methyltransferase
MANDRDLKGVLVNNYILKKKYNSKYPYLCICIENVSQKSKEILIKYGINIVECNFKELLLKNGLDNEYIDTIINKHFFGKFLIFLIQQFDKICYLDTDLLILKNLDNYFDDQIIKENTLYMVNDTLANPIENNGKQIGVFVKNMFNSGVIFFKSNNTFFDKLISILKEIGLNNFNKHVKTDQCILQIGMNEKYFNIETLHPKYNISPHFVESLISNKLIKIDDIIIIHFMNTVKPWDLLELDNYNNTLSIEINFSSVSMFYYKKWVSFYFDLINNKLFNNPIYTDEKYVNKHCLTSTNDINRFTLNNFKQNKIDTALKILDTNIRNFYYKTNKPNKNLLFIGASYMAEISDYIDNYQSGIFIEAIPDIFNSMNKYLLNTNTIYDTNYIPVKALVTSKKGDVMDFNIFSNHGQSSSIYKPGKYASEWDVEHTHTIKLISTTIKDILNEYNWNDKKYDVVLDVQGAELEVLKGFSENNLKNINIIKTEISKKEYYKGGVLFNELNDFFVKNNFKLLQEPKLDHCDVIYQNLIFS